MPRTGILIDWKKEDSDYRGKVMTDREEIRRSGDHERGKKKGILSRPSRKEKMVRSGRKKCS